MKVIIETRPIVGTLKTSLGTFHLLDDRSVKHGDYSRFHVVDDEGFENYIMVCADRVIIPASFIVQIDVKRVLTDEEEQPAELITHATIED
jgi:hypothetical protein